MYVVFLLVVVVFRCVLLYVVDVSCYSMVLCIADWCIVVWCVIVCCVLLHCVVCARATLCIVVV